MEEHNHNHDHNHDHNKYQEVINASQVVVDDAKVAAKVEKLIAEHLEENKNE